MPTKGTLHKTLLNLLKCDGCTNAIICDGSKERTLVKFKKKANEADIHIKHIEPYSPWSNQAEQCIRELRKTYSHAMMKTGTTKQVWDYCIESMA